MEILNGKKAIITGASRGLGKATALALAKEGVDVGVAGRNEADLQAVVQELKALGVNATYACFDVADHDAVKAGIKQMIVELGSVDILVNNAGVAAFGSVLEMDPVQWVNMVNTNLLGMYYVTREVLPYLVQQNVGDIICVSSTAGLSGNAGTSAYSASKFGVIGFAESLLKEVRKNNIRVCTLLPSTIASDMSLQLGITDGNPDKVLQPEDFADLVVLNLKLPRRAMLKSASLWSTNP